MCMKPVGLGAMRVTMALFGSWRTGYFFSIASGVSSFSGKSFWRISGVMWGFCGVSVGLLRVYCGRNAGEMWGEKSA